MATLDEQSTTLTEPPGEAVLVSQAVDGQVGFGELAFWLMAKRRPTAGQLAMFEAVLASLADHGLTPTALAARLTYTSAPESLQGSGTTSPSWPPSDGSIPGSWAGNFP